MKLFLREVIAAIKEGPSIFFAPVHAALKVASQNGSQQRKVLHHRTTPTTAR